MKKYKIKNISVRISPRMDEMIEELKRKTGFTTTTVLIQRMIVEAYNKEFYSNEK